jgi:hypothetical protein
MLSRDLPSIHGHANHPSEEQEDLVGELAWEYCQKSRNGEHPSIASYLRRLPNNTSRQEFQLLVAVDTFVDATLDFKDRLAMKE